MTTQTMTANHQSMTLGAERSRGWEPSRTSQATRSLRLADRLQEEGKRDEYRAALSQHFTEFGTRTAACSLG